MTVNERIEELSKTDEINAEIAAFVSRWAPTGMEKRCAKEMGELFAKIISGIFKQ